MCAGRYRAELIYDAIQKESCSLPVLYAKAKRHLVHLRMEENKYPKMKQSDFSKLSSNWPSPHRTSKNPHLTSPVLAPNSSGRTTIFNKATTLSHFAIGLPYAIAGRTLRTLPCPYLVQDVLSKIPPIVVVVVSGAKSRNIG